MPDGVEEYGHDLYEHVNSVSVSAFLSAGHEIIDVTTMLGQRVDAHPASAGQGNDALHFCMPGPLDYVLDLSIDRVVAAFSRPPPWLRRDAMDADFILSKDTKAKLAKQRLHAGWWPQSSDRLED